MKKRHLCSLMALFMLAVILVSCKDDDEEDNGSTDLKEILGTWRLQNWIVYLDGAEVEEQSGSATDTDYAKYEFKSDGTGVYTLYRDGNVSVSTDITWKVKGNKLILTYLSVQNGKDVKTEHTYSFDGDTIILITETSGNGHTGKEIDTLVKM